MVPPKSGPPRLSVAEYVVPPDCLWQNMWSPQTINGSHIWSSLATHSPPLLLRYTIGCAIINSTLVPILLCEQSLLPACLAVFAHLIRVNKECYNARGAAPPTGSWS